MEKEAIKNRMDENIANLMNLVGEDNKEKAEGLMDEILSLKGQMEVKPLEYNVGDRIDEFKGEYFEIVRTTEGAYFKTYGGLMLFARPNISSLYQTLCSFIDMKEEYEKLEGDEKENFELTLNILAYICTLPMYAFQDTEFAIDIATKVVDYLNKTVEEAMNQPLQEETPEENEEFRGAMESIDELKEVLENGEEE